MNPHCGFLSISNGYKKCMYYLAHLVYLTQKM